MLERLLVGVRGLLFAPRCLLCHGATTGDALLCGGCHGELPRNRRACHRCAAPLHGETASLCGACLRRPPPWERAIVPFLYAPPLDHLIQRFKFHTDLAAGHALGTLLAEALATREGALPELILPLPLHPSRLRTRGFNQALELARPVARRLGIPVVRDVALRTRATEVQSRLPAHRRHANVRGAFAVSRGVPARHVALLDDVLTTGHSAAEMTRVLLKGGAERVEVWALARAGNP